MRGRRGGGSTPSLVFSLLLLSAVACALTGPGGGVGGPYVHVLCTPGTHGKSRLCTQYTAVVCKSLGGLATPARAGTSLLSTTTD